MYNSEHHKLCQIKKKGIHVLKIKNTFKFFSLIQYVILISSHIIIRDYVIDYRYIPVLVTDTKLVVMGLRSELETILALTFGMTARIVESTKSSVYASHMKTYITGKNFRVKIQNCCRYYHYILLD